MSVGRQQDMHKKAWDMVADFVKNNLEFFPGKSLDAESTVLPSLTSWMHDSLSEIPES